MTLRGNRLGTGVSGVVLAGGKSRRMGTNKALLRLGNKSVIEHVVTRIADFVEDIYIIGNDADAYAFLGVPTISDRETGMGPLMGLYTGIISSKTPWVLAVACDTPFLEPRLIETILARPRDAVIIATEISAQAQPLPALYEARCGELAKALLSSGRRALRDLLASAELSIIPEAEVRLVDPELRSFLDLDTVEDLQRARRLMDSDS